MHGATFAGAFVKQEDAVGGSERPGNHFLEAFPPRSSLAFGNILVVSEFTGEALGFFGDDPGRRHFSLITTPISCELT